MIAMVIAYKQTLINQSVVQEKGLKCKGVQYCAVSLLHYHFVMEENAYGLECLKEEIFAQLWTKCRQKHRAVVPSK